MKTNISLLISGISLVAMSGLRAQELQESKPAFEFVRKGDLLTVTSSDGKNLGTIDLDKPALKGKVIAFTYSAKKKPTAENALTSIEIYPNPASKKVNLHFKGTWTYPIAVQVFDKTGNEIQATSLENAEQPLDIGSLAQGIYILKAHSGNASATEKLVVE